MAGTGKGKTSPAQIAVDEKQARALELRKAGATYPEIAVELGYASSSGAFEAVKSALKKTLAEPAQELRDLEIARLDTMQAIAWENMLNGDLEAMTMILRISERRSRLLGLDRKETPITVKLPKLSRPEDAMAVVSDLLEKATSGMLLPEEAAKLSGLVQAFLKVAETTELAERIAKLEGENGTGGTIEEIGGGAKRLAQSC